MTPLPASGPARRGRPRPADRHPGPRARAAPRPGRPRPPPPTAAGSARPPATPPRASPTSTRAAPRSPPPRSATAADGPRRRRRAVQPVRHPGLDPAGRRLARPGHVRRRRHGRPGLAAPARRGVRHARPPTLAGLELVNEQRLRRQRRPRRAASASGSAASTPALASMVTVGVAHGQIAYVSSSLTRTTGTPAARPLTPAAAWREGGGGRRPERPRRHARASSARRGAAGRCCTVPGLAQQQQTRLRALALADGSVRPVFETNVVDVSGRLRLGVHRDGRRRRRHDPAPPEPGRESSNGVFPFQRRRHRHRVRRQAPVRAHRRQDPDDHGDRGDGQHRRRHRRQDPRPGRPVLLASERHGHQPRGRDVHRRRDPGRHLRDAGLPLRGPDRPVPAAGRLRRLGDHQRHRHLHRRRRRPTRGGATSPPTRRSTPVAGDPDQLRHRLLAPRRRAAPRPAGSSATCRPSAPWDTTTNGVPTLTTVGNNASTHEAWAQPAGARAAPRRRRSRRRGSTPPSSPTRGTTRAATPTQLRPGGNDILASVTNLFVAHNRMHDYAYYLGFTEDNYNLQLDNGGRGGARRRPGDRQRAGRRAHRRRTVVPRSRQRQPDHPAGRHPRHHQPVPLPADRRRVLRALHRRRPRHGHRRPRVHPRDQQPDGRRARRGPDLRAGRRDGRVLGRPGRRRVHVQPRLPQRRQPVGRRRLRHRQHLGRDPRLRHRRQPAQLLRLRLRQHRQRGARRRRDLERHAVERAPGAGHQARRRLPVRRQGASSCAAPRAATSEVALPAAPPCARATAAGSS